MRFYPLQELSHQIAEALAPTPEQNIIGVAAFRLRDRPTEPGEYRLRLIEQDQGRAEADERGNDAVGTLVMTVADDDSHSISFATEFTEPTGAWRRNPSGRNMWVVILPPDATPPAPDLCADYPHRWLVSIPRAVFDHEHGTQLELTLIGPDHPGEEVEDDLAETDSSLYLLLDIPPRPGRHSGGGGSRRSGGGERAVEAVDPESWEAPDPTGGGASEWTEWRHPDQTWEVPARDERDADPHMHVRVNGERLPDTGGVAAPGNPTLFGCPLVRNGADDYVLLHGRLLKLLARVDRVVLEGEDDEGHLAVMGWGLQYGGRGFPTFTRIADERLATFQAEPTGPNAYRALAAKAFLLLENEGKPSAINTWDSQFFTLGPGFAGGALNGVFEKLEASGPETAQFLRDHVEWFRDRLRVTFLEDFRADRESTPARERRYRQWSEEARLKKLDIPNIGKIVFILEHANHGRAWCDAVLQKFTEDEAQLDLSDATVRDALHARAQTWAEQEQQRGGAADPRLRPHTGATASLRPLLAMTCYLMHGRPGWTPHPPADVHRALQAFPDDPTGQIAHVIKQHAQRLFLAGREDRSLGGEQVTDLLGRRADAKVRCFQQGMAEDATADGAWSYTVSDAVRAAVPAFQPEQSARSGVWMVNWREYEPPAGETPAANTRWPDRPPFPALDGRVWFKRGHDYYDLGAPIDGVELE